MDPILRLDRWMRDLALPFWASSGRCPEGGFVEQLAPDGSDARVPFKRMRVQARQTYVYAQASLLGVEGALEAASAGMAFMLAHGRAEGGGWVRRLGRSGGVLDPAIDLYDQAFVLFALAWYARASRSEEPLALARLTLGWIQSHMRAGEGFRNVLPEEPGWRQQNPHMHLLEAMLALHEASGEALWAEQGRALLELFRERLFDRASGTLGEFFDDGFAPAPGDAGSHVEPGHLFEWVWLLDRAGRQFGADLSREAAALYAFATTRGTDATGRVLDVVGRDGAVRDGAARLWPQTEAIKAHAVHPGGRARLPAQLEVLLDRYLVGEGDGVRPAGTWVDQIDAAGRPRVDRIPASSLYHVCMAWSELSGGPTT